jgi:hypothetical protein
MLFRAVELLVGARDRILAIVGDLLDALVKLSSALLAEPGEAIALVRPALALEDEDERVGREPRGMGRARGAVDDLALADQRDLLVTLGVR